MCTNGYNFLWTATSPDGASSINVLPQERWETNNVNGQPSTPGCQSAPYTTTRQYLESVVQRWRPGARVLDYRVREDLQREYAQLNRSTPMPMGEARSWAEAGEILFAFNQSGADMRGSIAAVVMFSQTRMSSGAGMPVMEYRSGFALPAYGVTAPNGQLNLQFFEAIRRSIKPNPQWEQRLNGHNAAIAQVALEESRKRAQIIAQSNADIAKIREETWNTQQESADRRAREFGELMRGVETYDDANAAGRPGGAFEPLRPCMAPQRRQLRALERRQLRAVPRPRARGSTTGGDAMKRTLHALVGCRRCRSRARRRCAGRAGAG